MLSKTLSLIFGADINAEMFEQAPSPSRSAPRKANLDNTTVRHKHNAKCGFWINSTDYVAFSREKGTISLIIGKDETIRKVPNISNIFHLHGYKIACWDEVSSELYVINLELNQKSSSIPLKSTAKDVVVSADHSLIAVVEKMRITIFDRALKKITKIKSNLNIKGCIWVNHPELDFLIYNDNR